MKTFVALAVLASLALAINADGSDFSDCAGKDNSEFVSAYTLNIKPAPIVAKNGKVVKEGVDLPCLPLPDLPIKVGSCKYEAQELLDIVPDDLWATFAPAGQAKSLPLNPGKYGDFDPNGAIE